jgi:hypothetical protein
MPLPWQATLTTSLISNVICRTNLTSSCSGALAPAHRSAGREEEPLANDDVFSMASLRDRAEDVCRVVSQWRYKVSFCMRPYQSAI